MTSRDSGILSATQPGEIEAAKAASDEDCTENAQSNMHRFRNHCRIELKIVEADVLRISAIRALESSDQRNSLA